MSDCSRRTLLKALVGITGASAVAAVTPGCLDSGLMPAPYVDAPPMRDGNVFVDVSGLPALEAAGGAVTVRASGAPDLLLVSHGDGTYVALASKCTHAGCPVGFNGDTVICPCHQSRFDLKGNVLSPPAAGPLRRYPAQLQPDLTVKIALTAGDGTFPAPAGGKLVLAFSSYPQLSSQGGSVVGTPEGLQDPLIVIALGGGQFAALSAACTHLGCTIEFAAGALECPCHGSTFTPDGAVTHGPATRPLPSFPVVADATAVTVTLG
jgi:cytochrome b6-f complex iron-sulfur subunit